MWTEAIKSAEGLISAIALLITAIGGTWLALKSIVKSVPRKDHNELNIVQGQTVSPESQWLDELKEDVDELKEENKLLSKQLRLALIRLSENGIQYQDLLEEIK